MNRGTKDALLCGDLLMDVAKLDKAYKVRLGTGGVAVGSTQTVVTGPFATLPAQALVYDVFVNVLTASTGTTKTLSVGTSGTGTGFLNSVDVSTTGIVRGLISAATSGPGTGGLFLKSTTYGSLLMTFTSGSTAAGDNGVAIQKTYPSDSNASRGLTFTPNSSDWVGGTFSADLLIFYTDLTR